MTEATARARYDFKRKLEELRTLKGRGTELISLYLPPNRQIFDAASYLRNELSQSSNIKSKGTRKNVTSAIESILSRLKSYRKPPENGVVFFVGHVPKGGDQTTMVSHVLEPPEPISTYLYRCDSQFFLEPLEAMLETKERYGLIVVDRSEATVGMLIGSRIETIKNLPSRVPSKHGRGGQSQRRFERLIEEAAHEFFKKVGGIATDAFLEQDLKGILVGGPGATKDFFVEKDYLHHELKKRLLDTFDTGYTNENGLKELVENAAHALSHLELTHEKEVMRRFMKEVIKDKKSLASYGEAEVRGVLEQGAVDVLIISEGLRKYRLSVVCESCGDSRTYTSNQKEQNITACTNCGSPRMKVDVVDVVDELSDIAESLGTSVEIISEDSDEGMTLMTAFGGTAAILRYSLNR
ncbi:MAG: peptide chain release factor aRF-1 [Thermoplasmata archaeon]|nr:peptide chain release factor aRF-1 [Thermoplasmata archaeon]